MQFTQYFKKFFQSSQSSGVLLLGCVFVSLLLANSSGSAGFQRLLDSKLGIFTLSSWINDGLMAVFFLLVGLEIKRELLEGELASFRTASLPVFAAVGGMVVPAVIYTLFTSGTEYMKGWGIPMATDIAFSLAILSMLGKRVPVSLKIFLAALAIVDDLGAIVVIALFYTSELHWLYLVYSAGILVVLALLNYFKVTRLVFYLIPGIFLWYFMHHSGIHATISGVLLAFTIPTNTSNEIASPLEKLEHRLHLPVNFFIMPLFALANTNITFQHGMVDGLFSNFGMGIIFGLVAGKVLGITLFSLIAVKSGLSALPDRAGWLQMTGTGFLAGIGFTMSVFIALLSFKEHPEIQSEAKFAVLVASVTSGIIGYVLLNTLNKNRKKKSGSFTNI